MSRNFVSSDVKKHDGVLLYQIPRVLILSLVLSGFPLARILNFPNESVKGDSARGRMEIKGEGAAAGKLPLSHTRRRQKGGWEYLRGIEMRAASTTCLISCRPDWRIALFCLLGLMCISKRWTRERQAHRDEEPFTRTRFCIQIRRTSLVTFCSTLTHTLQAYYERYKQK